MSRWVRYPFSSRLISLRKRHSVPWAMIFRGARFDHPGLMQAQGGGKRRVSSQTFIVVRSTGICPEKTACTVYSATQVSISAYLVCCLMTSWAFW